MRRQDTLIVGGGPAGTATAIGLALGGKTALLVERERHSADPLCGGFLSWTALRRLERLGLDVAALGARRITRLSLIAGTRVVTTDLPAPAASLSRATLDAALQSRAQSLGVEIERGVHVRDIDGDGARCADGRLIEADRIVLATGKHELRGYPRETRSVDPIIGLRWRLTLSPQMMARIDGVIELHCFRGGYAGLALQEDGRANLCLAIRQSRFDECGKKPSGVVRALGEELPVLAERLHHSTRIEDSAAIANVPYGWRYDPAAQSTFYRVGDQAGVIASLSGEGISLALASGLAAARSLLTGETPDRFHATFLPVLRKPVTVAQTGMQLVERPVGAWLTANVAAMFPGLARVSAKAMRITR
ncbi:NAD(P)/FAD-dependent oxidoreductase [Croceicoccus ponticola]|uniref:NAD(P)/FAD-dependent oxidoreductase n=1 Tax=Croceicoccus ponticola TaxID=2217664 RepID=UPI0013E326FD|nr:FAD-dependent oxidoreductase [Croceicoccus ponticola]